MEEVKDVYVYLEGLGTPEATAAKEVLKGHHKSMADRDAAARIMENTTIPSLKSQIQEAEQSVQGYVDGNASKDSQLQQALESIKDLQGKFDAKEKAEQVLTEENAFIKTSGDILSQAEANGINRSAFVDTASGRIKAGTLSIEGGEVKMTDGATEHKGAAVWETLKANNPWLVASKEGTASKAPSVAEPKTDISKMEAADLFAREYE
jgi:hypothetical protein